MQTGLVVAEPVIEPASMTDDQILALAQSTRIKIIRHITANAAATGGLPGDKEDRDALFKTLDGVEKIALTRKRISSDEKTAAGIAVATAGIAQLLRQSSSYYGQAAIVEEVTPPTLGSEVPEPVLVPGETEIDAPQLEYDSFVAGAKKA